MSGAFRTQIRTLVEAGFTGLKGEIKRLVGSYTGQPAPFQAPEPAPAPAVVLTRPEAEPPSAEPAPVFTPAPPRSAPKARAKAKRGAKAAKASGGPAAQAERIELALKGHARARELIKAGKSKDQLLRSLIPLYLARGLDGVAVNSGAISAFWKGHGVSFAGPNAAKALRGHAGHADKAGKGWAITESGVRYVEAALAGREAA